MVISDSSSFFFFLPSSVVISLTLEFILYFTFGLRLLSPHKISFCLGKLNTKEYEGKKKLFSSLCAPFPPPSSQISFILFSFIYRSPGEISPLMALRTIKTNFSHFYFHNVFSVVFGCYTNRKCVHLLSVSMSFFEYLILF